MFVKKEKMTVVIGSLLLVGVFALIYLGINAIAFADATSVGDENFDNYPYIEAIDDENFDDYEYQGGRLEGNFQYAETAVLYDIRWQCQVRLMTETAETYDYWFGHFNISRLVSMKDHYLTRYEAEVIVAEILYEKTGIEFDTSELVFGLLDQYAGAFRSKWLTSTRNYHELGRVYDIAIDAVTGDLLDFQGVTVVREYFGIANHNGIEFEIEDFYNLISGDNHQIIYQINNGTIDDDMFTQTEAALMAADLIYENYNVTMENLRMESNFGINIHAEIAHWRLWIMPVENVPCPCGSGNYHTPHPWFFVLVDAITGEIIEYRDYR